MSSSRYVGRHGSPRRGVPRPSVPGPGLARAAVKSVAGVGIVLGSGAFVIAPSSAVGAAGVETSLLEAGQSAATAGLLLEREAETTTGSRSGERAEDTSRTRERSAPAVTAPERAKGAEQASTGELAVDPVAKPEPEPQPEPVEETTTDEDTSAAGSSAGADTTTPEATTTPQEPVQTGAYASQAAALGLGPNASRVYSAVRSQFPDMTNIGGYRAGDPGDHGSGRAVDIMVTGARGDQVAAWLQQNAGTLNIKYVIWKQRIWNPGGTWEYMADRGSTTANHYDHVHVSVY